MDSNDGLVYFYNPAETAATLAMAVSNDEIGISNSEDQENYATGFLEGFFEDLDATAVNIADDKLIQDNFVALKFTTSGGDTPYQGAAVFTLQDNMLDYALLAFAQGTGGRGFLDTLPNWEERRKMAMEMSNMSQKLKQKKSHKTS